MALDLRDCSFIGPALPEPFVKFQMERLLRKDGLLPTSTGNEGKALAASWDSYRRKLRLLGEQGGAQRVANHVLEPLAERLGYTQVERQAEVVTREGAESGGWLFKNESGDKLRAWACDVGQDLDAPSRRGRAFRYSPSQVALRVLQSQGERVGLLTDGLELRLLICDASRKESHIAVRLDRSDGGWRATKEVPDSYRLLFALASPAGVKKIAALVDEARLAQTNVTAKLRVQARQAVLDFVNEILDRPQTETILSSLPDEKRASDALARDLWHEGLVFIYRLLFVFQLEASPDPARAFTFASSSLWRTTYSPSQALAPIARRVLDAGAETGRYLEDGLRALFRMFESGLQSSEMKVSRLAGMLFAEGSTPLLDRLSWGERAVALLLDRLLWTDGESARDTGKDRKREDKSGRERVHYGALDVENLGRVYEALLELEPGLATEPMCRLRRDKLEVVLPAAQGEPYRPKKPDAVTVPSDEADDAGTEIEDSADEDESSRKKAKVVWVESIPPGRFYLRVGLGRKASGSYYTPHPFVTFLVEETLDPQLAERSPKEDPQPGKILTLRVLDPAMGSGHFLVEVCRFLGDRLYEACRLCDELALKAEDAAARATEPEERERLIRRAAELRQRVIDLPDPNDELLAYLPSRAVEGEASGLSQSKARAIARRLVAVHCLYGVDKNPLAVELAKLSLWLESYAEGLPLTFLDHRLVCGDSLTGPFVSHLSTYPRSGEPIDQLFARNLKERLEATLTEALQHIIALEATVGTDVADTEQKRVAKRRLDESLAPLRTLAAAWSGLVQRGPSKTDGADDEAYAALADAVAHGRDLSAAAANRPVLADAIRIGRDAVAYDLTFPEVFFPAGKVEPRGGFDAVVGNPPWDKLRIERRDFLAGIDLKYLVGKESAGVGQEHIDLENVFHNNPMAQQYASAQDRIKRASVRILTDVTISKDAVQSTSDPDLYRFFLLRTANWLRPQGQLGFIVGGGIAKVPSDQALREWIFREFGVRKFLHYLNLKQLFGGASSRISFVCLLAVSDSKGVSCGFQFEMTGYDDLRSDVSSLHRCDKVLHGLQKGASLIELTSGADIPIFVKDCDALTALEALGVVVSADLHRTSGKISMVDISSVLPTSVDARQPDLIDNLLQKNYAPLYAGRSMDIYDSYPTKKSGKWDPSVYELVLLSHSKSLGLLNRIRFFRLCWRATCGLVATNDRSAKSAILPPGCIAGHSLLIETAPSKRPNSQSLIAMCVFNSFSFDWSARRIIQSNINGGVLSQLYYPPLQGDAIRRLMTHSALRLSCKHAGFSPLWIEQLGSAWRELVQPGYFPVLDGDDARWTVRAAIDAVVADAYGLSLEKYEHILTTFNHKNYPNAPKLCLAAFSELKQIGLDAFVRKYDPYWDIPLVRSLPQPVLTFPQLADDEIQPDSGSDTSPPSTTDKPPAKRGRKPKAQEVAEPVLPLFANLASPPKTSRN